MILESNSVDLRKIIAILMVKVVLINAKIWP